MYYAIIASQEGNPIKYPDKSEKICQSTVNLLKYMDAEVVNALERIINCAEGSRKTDLLVLKKLIIEIKSLLN